MLTRPIAIALILAALLPGLSSAAPYTIIDLGELDDSIYNSTSVGSLGTAINSHGHVAGTSSSISPRPPGSPPERNVFLHSENQMHDLGRLPYTVIRPDPFPSLFGWHDRPTVSGINNNGQVVGASNWAFSQFEWNLPWQAPPYDQGPSSSLPSRAFLSNGGVLQNLGTLSGDHRSWALGISDDGQVIGVSQSLNNGTGAVVQHRSFFYSGGVMQEFGSLINPSYGVSNPLAIDIGAGGQVLAEGTINGERHGFMYDNGLVQDLGVLAPGYSFTHISDSGNFVAGTGPWDGHSTPILLHHDGVTQTLEDFEQTLTFVIGSQEYDVRFEGQLVSVSGVNSSGQLVGTATITDVQYGGLFGSWTGPFLYSEGAVRLLPDLVGFTGWGLIAGNTIPLYPDLQAVTDINDAGQMTGWGSTSNGRAHAFLMTPVPEPSSYIVALLGGVGLLGWQALRRTPKPRTKGLVGLAISFARAVRPLPTQWRRVVRSPTKYTWLVLVICTALCSQVHAGSVTYNDGLPYEVLPASLLIPQWDQAAYPGQALSSVTVGLFFEGTAGANVAELSGSTSLVFYSASGSASLTLPNSQQLVASAPTQFVIAEVPGLSSTYLTVWLEATEALTYTNPIDLEAFTGVGSVSMLVDVSINASAEPPFGVSRLNGGAGASVTYEWTPVPEPPSAALGLAGTAILGIASCRCRRAGRPH